MTEFNDAQKRLAARLRELRASWPDVAVKQADLARAFGDAKSLSVPLISSWESQTNPKIPPPRRLESYAIFFATVRSMAEPDGPRLLKDGELTADERAARAALSTELNRMRAAALGSTWTGTTPATVSLTGPALTMGPASPARPASSASPAELSGEAQIIMSLNFGPWRFKDGEPITIVCAQLPPEMLKRIPYSDPMDPDYVALYRYADLDAFIELHGHIRAANPGSQVNFRTTADLRPDDYTTHLVSLGGVDWNHATRSLLTELALPVAQVGDWSSEDGPYFEAQGTDQDTGGAPMARRFHPTLEVREDGKVLREDVALFARAVNPFNSLRTVTICNGMYAGGTFGAVRALTDARFRDRNAEYVRDIFAHCQAFCILMRVRVQHSAPLTPDWTKQDHRLFEWMSN